VKYRSLVRATPPAVEPVTLAEAKAHLRVDTADDDTYIAAIIKAAREWCEEYLDRSLVHTQWTMRMDSFPHEFVLPRPPMATSGTVTATTITYTLETQAVETLDPATYRVDRHDTPGRIRVVYAGTWPAHLFDENSVTVTWWGGYGADGTSVPAAIKHAMLFLIAHFYENRMPVVGTGAVPQQTPLTVRALLDSVKWGSYR
jgi:uncharacterized phiE125 gp8 family phage protein